MTSSPTAPRAPEPITEWLSRWRAGHHDALERIVPVVYEQLRQVARRQLRHEASPAALSATTLVHETYLRLLQQRQLNAEDRDAFLTIAAHTMRRILVDQARRRKRVKRGGDQLPVPLDEENEPQLLNDTEIEQVLALDDVLQRLGKLDERAARVVEYRIFAGLTLEETAQALHTSTKTVQRTWTTARAWLRKELER